MFYHYHFNNYLFFYLKYNKNIKSEHMNDIFNEQLESDVNSITLLYGGKREKISSKRDINKFFKLMRNTKLIEFNTDNIIFWGMLLEINTNNTSIYMVCYDTKIVYNNRHYYIDKDCTNSIRKIFGK